MTAEPTTKFKTSAVIDRRYRLMLWRADGARFGG
jgi:hypothetical protein